MKTKLIVAILILLALPLVYSSPYQDLKDSALSLNKNLENLGTAPSMVYIGTSFTDQGRKDVITLVYRKPTIAPLSWKGFPVESIVLPQPVHLSCGHCEAESVQEFYPGERISGEMGGTGAFILNKDGKRLVSTARHVSGSFGNSVFYYSNSDQKLLGKVSYASSTPNIGDDFALIEVDPEAELNPSITTLGGPKGIFKPGTITNLGYPIPVAKRGIATKDSYGLLIAESPIDGSFVFILPATKGDSGSPIVTFNWPLQGDSLAVGVITHGIYPVGPANAMLVFGTPLYKKMEKTQTTLETSGEEFCGASQLNSPVNILLKNLGLL